VARSQQDPQEQGQAGYAAAPVRALSDRPPIGTSKSRRRFRVKEWPMALAATVGAVTFLSLTDLGRDTRGPTSFSSQIDDVAVGAGFGLDEVVVSGHKFTNLDDVFAVIGLEHVRVIWRADIAAIKAQVEQLPWVAEAIVARDGLNALRVTLVERRPSAIWSAGVDTAAAHYLIDATGRVLGPIMATAPSDLLRLSGVGGADALPHLIALLQSVPDLKARVIRADYVSQRRWSLTLASGLVLHLPHDADTAALRQAAMFSGQPGEIDVSVAGRISVRAATPKPAVTSPQSVLSNGS
jgi:cell division protein FtsQ